VDCKLKDIFFSIRYCFELWKSSKLKERHSLILPPWQRIDSSISPKVLLIFCLGSSCLNDQTASMHKYVGPPHLQSITGKSLECIVVGSGTRLLGPSSSTLFPGSHHGLLPHQPYLPFPVQRECLLRSAYSSPMTCHFTPQKQFHTLNRP
jgi:hypothetical protein